ncbi:hypothetical protein AA313_de0202910 [Arthrobotrys entomopaga]|nr:hypothetical protein AA313_de0202910 [Arthrobotrys entomopaga]
MIQYVAHLNKTAYMIHIHVLVCALSVRVLYRAHRKLCTLQVQLAAERPVRTLLCQVQNLLCETHEDCCGCGFGIDHDLYLYYFPSTSHLYKSLFLYRIRVLHLETSLFFSGHWRHRNGLRDDHPRGTV